MPAALFGLLSLWFLITILAVDAHLSEGGPGKECAAESLRKGDRILVAGQVHTEAWTDSDVVKRTKQVITDAELGASLRFTSLDVARRPREQATTG